MHMGHCYVEQIWLSSSSEKITLGKKETLLGKLALKINMLKENLTQTQQCDLSCLFIDFQTCSIVR